MIQTIFNMIAVVFILWMTFKWRSDNLLDSIVKVGLFLTAILGIILLIIEYRLL